MRKLNRYKWFTKSNVYKTIRKNRRHLQCQSVRTEVPISAESLNNIRSWQLKLPFLKKLLLSHYNVDHKGANDLKIVEPMPLLYETL